MASTMKMRRGTKPKALAPEDIAEGAVARLTFISDRAGLANRNNTYYSDILDKVHSLVVSYAESTPVSHLNVTEMSRVAKIAYTYAQQQLDLANAHKTLSMTTTIIRGIFVAELLNRMRVGYLWTPGADENGTIRKVSKVIEASLATGGATKLSTARTGRNIIRSILRNGGLYPEATTALDYAPQIAQALGPPEKLRENAAVLYGSTISKLDSQIAEALEALKSRKYKYLKLYSKNIRGEQKGVEKAGF